MAIFIVWIPLEQKTNLNYIKKVCGNKDFCNIVMPSENIKILEIIHYKKYDKAIFIIYADLNCLREKIDGCKSWKFIFS